MKNIDSLKNYGEFKNVYDNGKSYANKYLVMYVIRNEENRQRLGISVSKKVGNSVVRHRVTRLIRESFRLNKSLLSSSLSIVVVGRTTAKGRSYKEIESAFIHLCRLHGICIDK
ncbi:MAG: ribonuclease P protein component [Lachnospiraceae bacterium]